MFFFTSKQHIQHRNLFVGTSLFLSLSLTLFFFFVPECQTLPVDPYIHYIYSYVFRMLIRRLTTNFNEKKKRSSMTKIYNMLNTQNIFGIYFTHTQISNIVELFQPAERNKNKITKNLFILFYEICFVGS